MKDKNNLWKLLGYLNRVGGELNSPGLPFIYGMLPDEKEPTTYRTTINGPNFILVDINVYFEDGDNSEYKKIINDIILNILETYLRKYLEKIIM